MKNLFFVLTVVMTISVATGCALNPKVQTKRQSATISINETTSREIKNLPQPVGKIPVAVYNFRDQTGQYKPQENVSSFSTAVTQGATSILVESLEQSDWFIPIEREGIQNILTERKIIRAAQKSEEGSDAIDVPPLQTASIILEGGIIGFDTNVNTGGISGGYYGFSLGELYRTDVVTAHLRAIDVKTGVVLASVSTSKTVLSQQIRTGLFRYVELNRLAEAEAGYSINEPSYKAVEQAIQKAVVSLIVKGLEKKLWRLKDVKQYDSALIRSYREELGYLE